MGSTLYYLTLVILFSTVTLFSTMASLSCITWNINGCRDSFKRYQIFEFIKINHPVDVVFLQETHTTQLDESSWQVVWRSPIHFSHGSTNSAGVAILFNPRKKVDILSVNNVVPGRLLHIHANIDNSPVHLINVYTPTIGSERLGFF